MFILKYKIQHFLAQSSCSRFGIALKCQNLNSVKIQHSTTEEYWTVQGWMLRA